MGIAVIGALLFAAAQTGSGKAMGTKISRNLSEMTGGLMGKKKDKKSS